MNVFVYVRFRVGSWRAKGCACIAMDQDPWHPSTGARTHTHTHTHTHTLTCTLTCTHVHKQKLLRNLILKHTCLFMYLYTYTHMYSIIIPQTHVHIYSIHTLIHMCICPQTHTLIDTYMGATTLHFSHCETPPYLVRAHYNPFYSTSLLLSFKQFFHSRTLI